MDETKVESDESDSSEVKQDDDCEPFSLTQVKKEVKDDWSTEDVECQVTQEERNMSVDSCEPGEGSPDFGVKKPKVFSCHVCSRQFKEKSKLVQHIRTHTGERPYKCDKCNKQFVQKVHLGLHQRVHTGEKPYECRMCLRRFRHRSSFVSHQLTHLKVDPVTCEIGMSNTTESVGQKFTRPKRFECLECHKMFSRRTHLKDHMRIHTGEKPFKCDVCGVGFSIRSTLTSHMRLHTGERPYSCEFCFMKFSQNSHLTRHRYTHINALEKLD